MDLNDSFTEQLLQRNKARKQYLNAKQNETVEVIAKKYSVLVEEQQIPTSGVPEESPKRHLEENEESPKRQCIEKYEGSPSRHWPPSNLSRMVSSEKENAPVSSNSEESFVPFKSASRGLAALKKKDSNTCGLTSEAERSNPPTYVFSTNTKEICSGRKNRLAHLAADVNQWEDDLHHSTFSSSKAVPSDSSKVIGDKSRDIPIAISKSETINSKSSTDLVGDSLMRDTSVYPGALNSNSSKVNKPFPSKNKIERDENFKSSWNEAIKATLGTEETKKSPSKAFKAVNEKWEKMSKDADNNKRPMIFLPKKKIKMFDQEEVKQDLNKSFDPTDLPLSARKAIFEQASSGNIGKNNQSFEPKLSVAQRAALFESGAKKGGDSNYLTCCKSKSIPTSQLSPCKPPQMPQNAPSNYLPSPQKIATTPQKSYASPKKITTPQKSFASPQKATEGNIKVGQSPVKKLDTDTGAVEQMLLARVNSQVHATEPVSQQAKPNLPLVNYWEKLSASSKSANSNSDEEYPENLETTENDSYSDDAEGYESETESKYERESGSESNYTEATEDYIESEPESDMPLEKDVFKSPKGLPPVRSAVTQVLEKSSPLKSSSSSKTSNWQSDNFVDDSCDAVSLSDCNSYDGSVTSIDAKFSDKFRSYSGSSSSVGSSYDPESSKESEENFAKNNCGSNSDTPLLYTVSFYRKQRQGTRTPPMKTIVRREQVTSSPTKSNQTEAIQEQIKLYQEEILKQQTIISQTSQALNLCHATTEFSGSAEQVEGERLLLIATQKRQALLNEIQRLKAHGAEGDAVVDGTGTLTISDLQLPLKQEFLAAQLEGRINDAVHWFLCLIRHGAQVIVTQMVSTDDNINNGALCFTNYIKLQNLPPDFSVIFEVYALQTKKERLTHDKKYHIKRDKSTMRLTPKGKKSDGKLLLPAISSPGGPNAVRSPSFGVIGYTRFNIQNCNKKCFTLDKIPFTSPLDGVLRVKLHLHAEHKVIEKGFLTMFEDVSGFGAWHRRWCALNAQHLTYWKYPDDENKKEPIGTIDLKQCVTDEVRPVSRDVCARAHTFQLVTVRPQRKEDKNSLTTHCNNTLTTTKHLLSADTKEERILWCNKLNEALRNVRKWNPQALRPVETKL